MTCLVVFTGCKSKNKRNLLPNVSGKAGEVLVVIERAEWEADLGVAIREVLSGDTPYLAQREPLFALSTVPPGSFNSMFKVHRNLLLININPQAFKRTISDYGITLHCKPGSYAREAAERMGIDYAD